MSCRRVRELRRPVKQFVKNEQNRVRTRGADRGERPSDVNDPHTSARELTPHAWQLGNQRETHLVVGVGEARVFSCDNNDPLRRHRDPLWPPPRSEMNLKHGIVNFSAKHFEPSKAKDRPLAPRGASSPCGRRPRHQGAGRLVLQSGANPRHSSFTLHFPGFSAA